MTVGGSKTGTGWITGRGLTPGHELSGVFSNGLALADVIIRDYKRYYDAHRRRGSDIYTGTFGGTKKLAGTASIFGGIAGRNKGTIADTELTYMPELPEAAV